MERSFFNRVGQWLTTAKRTRAIQTVNGFLESPWGLAAMSVLTLCAYVFSLELWLYGFVAVFCIYVALFCDDFLPLMGLFVFCYIAPSRKNNPGMEAESVYFASSGGVYILIFAAIALVCFIVRLALDKSIGFKKLFTHKRTLLSGMLILSAAYFISGIGSEGYQERVGKHLLFSLLQFSSIVVLYFLFSATVKWNQRCIRYFAWLGVCMGLVCSLELVHIYLTANVIVNGVIDRGPIYTGWGITNNIGAMIAMSIPFAFYLACKSKRPYLFIILATVLETGLFFSCSRTAILCGSASYIAGFVIAFLKSEEKRVFRISTYVFLGICLVGALASLDFFLNLFQGVPSIVGSSESGGLKFNDSGRFNIYKEGLKVFARSPIFGESFFPRDYAPWEFSVVEKLSSVIPPRWHNTFIQLGASCGLVGLLAYGFHRYQTVKLFLKKRTFFNLFIAIALIALVLMSMLDCHFFNIGPVLFYSMALAVAENAEEEKQTE